MSLLKYVIIGTLSAISICSAADSDITEIENSEASFKRARKNSCTFDYSKRRIGDDALIAALPHINGCLLSTAVQEILRSNGEKPIKELNLSDNIIGDWGAEFLAEKLYPQLEHLKILNLSNNWITESAIKYTAPVLQQPNFKYLVITGNQGATIHGITNLRNELSQAKTTFHTCDFLLKKVIWVKEEDIDSYVDAYLLQLKQAQAHRRYYQALKGQKQLVIRDLSTPEIVESIVPEILNDLKSSVYNDEKFKTLAHKAIEDTESAYLIGREYYSGTKLKRNYKKAAEWFTFAAKKDHIKAIEDLAVLYRHGFLPVTKDLLADSKALMTRATEKGAKLSVSYID